MSKNTSSTVNEVLNDIIVRKISFDNKTIERAVMMASKYYAKNYLDKSIKPDELLSQVVKDSIEYTFENKFMKDLNS